MSVSISRDHTTRGRSLQCVCG